MPRTSSLAPSLAALALLAVAHPARAEQGVPAQPPQLAPLPPNTVAVQPGYATPPPGGTTVIVQPPYGQPMYGQPGQPYYVQPPPMAQPPAAGPRVIRGWDDSQPLPAGYHTETHVRTGLVIGGAVTFGTLWLLSAFSAAISSDINSVSGGSSQSTALYIPAIGPFIQMTQTSTATGNFFLAIDGIAQIGGLAMFTIGLAAPRTDAVRNEVGFDVKVAPIVGRDHTGMGLVGRF